MRVAAVGLAAFSRPASREVAPAAALVATSCCKDCRSMCREGCMRMGPAAVRDTQGRCRDTEEVTRYLRSCRQLVARHKVPRAPAARAVRRDPCRVTGAHLAHRVPRAAAVAAWVSSKRTRRRAPRHRLRRRSHRPISSRIFRSTRSSSVLHDARSQLMKRRARCRFGNRRRDRRSRAEQSRATHDDVIRAVATTSRPR